MSSKLTQKDHKYTSNMDDSIQESLPQILTFSDIKQAANRIGNSIIHTPLCESKITKFMDYNIYLKCENLQFTGSCAERGIRNAFEQFKDEYKASGVMVPSCGNHALGAAYHGKQLGIPVTVVMPDATPPATAQRCSELGAEVILCGENVDDANTYIKKVHKSKGQYYLKSDDLAIMAGLGTVGLEILAQLPETDAVLVPVASGSLLASIIVACKKLKCTCLVYGVECSKVPKMMKALQAGQPEPVPLVPNLADGLNNSIVGENAFANIKGRLDRMLLVDEVWIARAMIGLVERERLVSDSAGVCAVAAVMQGLVPELRGKRAVCIISSGNIESGRLSRVIQRGLGASGRLLRFAVAVPDNRAGLENLTKSIYDESAVLKSIVTEQMWVHSDVTTTWANVIVETANEDHSAIFKEKLRQLYPSARFAVMDYEHKSRIGLR